MSIGRLCWLWALSGFLSMSSISAAASLDLARNGSTEAVILLPAPADEIEQEAAAELAEYLKKITGADFAVVAEEAGQKLKGPVLSVGRTNLAEQLASKLEWPGLEHREAFRIKRAGKVIVIRGNIDSEAASEASRHGVYTFLEHLGVRWFLPGELGERYPRIRDLTIEQLDTIDAPAMDFRKAFFFGRDKEHNQWTKRNKSGGPEVKMYHNFGDIYQRNRDKHPEWFVQGKMACVSHPGFRAQFAEDAIKAFDGDPRLRAYSLTPYDAHFKGCNRPRCQELAKISVTDLMIDFYNEVSDAVAAKHPGKGCAGLAYLNYLSPPRKLKVSPNFIPILAPLSLSENSPRFDRIVQGWRKLSDQVYIYSYSMGNTNNPVRTGRRFANYRKWGLKGIEIERRPTWAYSGLNYWMENRLAWDWTADPDKLVEEFCLGLFGSKAGPIMKTFMYSYAVKEHNSWEQRKALLERAAGLLADKEDSAEARCVRMFQLGEALLAMPPIVASAERNSDWKTVAAAAKRGVDAYQELQTKYSLYYQESGDRYRSPHWNMVRYLPYYRAAAAYDPPTADKPRGGAVWHKGKGLLLADIDLATKEHSEGSVAGVSLERSDGWNVTLDLKAEYDVTQVEISIRPKKPGTPLFVHISWSQEWQDERFQTVDRIYLRGKGGRDELYRSRLFSVRARYVRLHVGIKEGMFDVGQIRVWGHSTKE